MIIDRELDVEIAKKVFEFNDNLVSLNGPKKINELGEFMVAELPHYSISIKEAMDVVMKMQKEGWLWELGNTEPEGSIDFEYFCSFEVSALHRMHIVYGTSLCRCICEAALKALEPLKLSERDSKQFVEMLNSDEAPNEALKKAAEEYNYRCESCGWNSHDFELGLCASCICDLPSKGRY